MAEWCLVDSWGQTTTVIVQQQWESGWCLWERSACCLPGVVSSSTSKLGLGMVEKGEEDLLVLFSEQQPPISLVPRMNLSNHNSNYFSEYPEINNWSRGLLVEAVKHSWGK